MRTGRKGDASVPKQLFEGVARLGFPGSVGGILGLGHVLAPDHFEILAVVGDVFFRDGFRAPVAALVGDRAVVTHAIQTYLQVRAANTRLRPAGGARQCVFKPAFPAMSRRCHGIIVFSSRNLASGMEGVMARLGKRALERDLSCFNVTNEKAQKVLQPDSMQVEAA